MNEQDLAEVLKHKQTLLFVGEPGCGMIYTAQTVMQECDLEYKRVETDNWIQSPGTAIKDFAKYENSNIILSIDNIITLEDPILNNLIKCLASHDEFNFVDTKNNIKINFTGALIICMTVNNINYHLDSFNNFDLDSLASRCIRYNF